MILKAWKNPKINYWKKACKTSKKEITEFILKEMRVCIHEFPKLTDDDYYKRFQEGDSDNLYKCRKCEKWISSLEDGFEPNLFTPEGFFKILHWLIEDLEDIYGVYTRFLFWGERDGWTKNHCFKGEIVNYEMFPRVLYSYFLECIDNDETFGDSILVQNCVRCGRKLNNPKDLQSLACGNDCKGCVEEIEKHLKNKK